MKYALTYILLCLFPATAFCQVQVGAAIQNDHQKIFYKGVGNPLTVAAEGCKLKDIIVSTDNGHVDLDSSGGMGHYYAWPIKEGKAIIYVKRKLPHGRIKTIDSVLFVVKSSLLIPHRNLSGSSGGHMSQSLLLAQIAPGAYYYEVCARASIISFTVEVYRKDRILFKRTLSNPNGTRIDSVTRDFFHWLKNNDEVIFKDITTMGLSRVPQVIEPMEFTITDAHKYRRIQVDESETVFDPVTGTEIQKPIKYKFVRDDDEEY